MILTILFTTHYHNLCITYRGHQRITEWYELVSGHSYDLPFDSLNIEYKVSCIHYFYVISVFVVQIAAEDVYVFTQGAATMINPGLLKSWCLAPSRTLDVIHIDTLILLFHLILRIGTTANENKKVVVIDEAGPKSRPWRINDIYSLDFPAEQVLKTRPRHYLIFLECIEFILYANCQQLLQIKVECFPCVCDFCEDLGPQIIAENSL